jgi:outer membrane protein TolC
MRSRASSRRLLKWCCAALLASTGCSGVQRFDFQRTWESAPSYHLPYGMTVEYPNVKSNMAPAVAAAPAPLSAENPAELPARELLLSEAVQLAMCNSDIMRQLGASIVQIPQGAVTNFDPALVDTNPLGGVEAALSAFDAVVVSQLFWQVNNRPNNIALSDNPILQQFQRQAFQETAAVFNYGIAKRTATGASFAARHNVRYSLPNTPNLLFPSSYTGNFEFEMRQPLMRGAGVDYNRIAGPDSFIGQYNGVLIARINTDISLADFEAGIINFVNDVETAYWELYFTYHFLEAQVAGRNSALVTWQQEKTKLDAGASDRGAVAQARSQYFQFEALVTDALRGPQGLFAAEQRLRYLLGLPPTDGQLLKPISPPMEGEIIVDWDTALRDALTKRVEIRRQKWSIKRRELELIAARLNRQPNLDFLGQYRYVGLGDSLIDSRDPNNAFNSLYQNIFEGDYQEWQAGVELGYPIGLRQAGAAVANARWGLAREQALLQEQELRISHDLSQAARSIDRAYALVEANFNRQAADREQTEVLRERVNADLDNINFLLQAQRLLATSQSAYFRSLADYQLALRDFHREKGSLLNYNQVGLSEGPWPSEARQNAVERGRFFTPRVNPEAVEQPNPVSSGRFDPTQVGAVTNYPAGIIPGASPASNSMQTTGPESVPAPPGGLPMSPGATRQ